MGGVRRDNAILTLSDMLHYLNGNQEGICLM